jgi:hypothetical protein
VVAAAAHGILRRAANELTKRVLTKAIALLAVYGTAMAFALLAYWDYRDSNVSRTMVSKLSDLEQEFEIGDAGLKVKNPDFVKVCFAGDYVYALKDAGQWFSAGDTEFTPTLRAAGGRADAFNGEERSSIVLLSHTSAVIVQLDRRTGFAVANFGCANVNEGEIKIRKYLTNSSREFFLPNATLKATGSREQPPATLCAQGLHRFVESIDEQLDRDADHREYYWAAIRKFLPRKGCTAEEVISIVKTSRFFMPLDEPMASAKYAVILFGNSETVVHFALERATGNIEYPSVGPLHPPTPST